MTDKDTVRLLERFSAAWNAHDADKLMELMTEDCVFHASAGIAPHGTEFRGQKDVREASAAIWRRYPDAAWNDPVHFASGERAASEWTFTGTDADGNSVNVYGCDLFLIRNGKIAVKDSFRKQVS